MALTLSSLLLRYYFAFKTPAASHHDWGSTQQTVQAYTENPLFFYLNKKDEVQASHVHFLFCRVGWSQNHRHIGCKGPLEVSRFNLPSTCSRATTTQLSHGYNNPAKNKPPDSRTSGLSYQIKLPFPRLRCFKLKKAFKHSALPSYMLLYLLHGERRHAKVTKLFSNWHNTALFRYLHKQPDFSEV